jgi:hypothetical protein
VLVAMFIMTIGMLSLLALFPLGVLRMMQSLNDERAAQSIQLARQVALVKDIRHDSKLTSPSDYFKNPGGTATPDAVAGTPSYAVYVDPQGVYLAAGTAAGNYVGGSSPQTIRRIEPSFATTTSPTTFRPWFTLTDELQFDTSFQPRTVGSQIMKEINFSWAYLVQRPDYGNPQIVQATAVIYYKRPMGLGSSLQLAENFYPSVPVDTVNNRLTLPNTGPTVKVGDWLLDCTVDTTGGKVIPHARFYRIVSVDVQSAATVVEVHVPLQGFASLSTGKFLLLDAVYDVVDLGVGRLP